MEGFGKSVKYGNGPRFRLRTQARQDHLSLRQAAADARVVYSFASFGIRRDDTKLTAAYPYVYLILISGNAAEKLRFLRSL